MATRKQTEDHEVEYCRVGGCGGILNEDRFCDKGQGYPFYIQHQTAFWCWMCQPLHWIGNCMRCWNRYETSGPGYYFEDVDGHWQNTGAKQRMFSKEELREKMGELAGMVKLDLEGSVPF